MTRCTYEAVRALLRASPEVVESGTLQPWTRLGRWHRRVLMAAYARLSHQAVDGDRGRRSQRALDEARAIVDGWLDGSFDEGTGEFDVLAQKIAEKLADRDEAIAELVCLAMAEEG